jgi:hypothetical protein
MKQRNMPHPILGNFPTELAEHADPGLRRPEFEGRLQTYLRDQDFPEDKNLVRLVPTLFRITRYYLRTKKVLPRMLKIVNSRDWLTRAKLLAQIGGVELPRLRKRFIRKARRKGTMTKAVALWTSRELKNLSRTLRLAFDEQLMEYHAVRGLAKPPFDAQYLYEVRDFLREKMRKARVEDIDLIVAGCAVAAQMFSSEEAAKDIVSEFEFSISLPIELTGATQAYVSGRARAVRVEETDESNPGSLGVGALIESYQISRGEL